MSYRHYSTGWEVRGLNPGKFKRFFLKTSTLALGRHIFNAHRPFIPGVMSLWRDADRSPPFSAEVKNEWSHISTLPYIFMAWAKISF
jgi:hypothetical protein